MSEFIFSEIEYWLSKGMSAEDCAKALCDIYGKEYEHAMFLVRLFGERTNSKSFLAC